MLGTPIVMALAAFVTAAQARHRKEDRPMSGLFGAPPSAPPPMPVLPEPVVMPESDKETLRRNATLDLAVRRSKRTTRQSTILGDEDRFLHALQRLADHIRQHLCLAPLLRAGRSTWKFHPRGRTLSYKICRSRS